MAFITFNHYSQSLGMATEAYVIIPQRNTMGEIGLGARALGDKYRCLYLLHGLTDDHTIWMRRTSIERYAAQYGIAVVMPEGHRSFYTDMAFGGDYYKYVSEELPALIQEFFNISGEREDNFVAGLSMGGYGALKLGLRNPERFAACAGMSSVADIKACVTGEHNELNLATSIFGQDIAVPEDDDLFALADKHAGDEVKPRVYMACGMEDAFHKENVELSEKLKRSGYDLTWYDSHGIHEWNLWDEYIQYVLKWMF